MIHTHQHIDQQPLRFLYTATRPAYRPCQDIWGDERMSVNKTRTACENSTMSFEDLHEMLPKAFEQYLKKDRYAVQPISPHIHCISYCAHLRHICTIGCVTCMHAHTGEAANRCEVLCKGRLSVTASMEDIRREEDEGVDRYTAHHTRWYANAHSHRIATQQTRIAVVTCS